ncbi:hypothetical protein V2J09_018542 [Rumex salicifolius]
MGRPPSNGGPAFRFTPNEVAEMEAILHEHGIQIPSRDLIVALSEKFSQSAERVGKMTVQVKQVWNWFQNRRFALRSKLPRPLSKSNSTAMPPEMAPIRNAPLGSQPQPAQFGRSSSENPQMEFEAKSARDGAWYDVQAFLSHRYLDTGDLEVRVRCAGFGADEDEWVNVTKHVRQRSLPCESTECFAVMPGDLILCFQEGKEQALYFDAHVLDAQRRRHDARGCRCRFLVRYDHDLTEEIVPLRKVCRRPETDYRLQPQQQHPTNEPSPKVVSASSVPTPKPANLNAPTETIQKTTSNVITNVIAIPSSANPSGVPGIPPPEPKRVESVTPVPTGTLAAAPTETAKQ